MFSALQWQVSHGSCFLISIVQTGQIIQSLRTGRPPFFSPNFYDVELPEDFAHNVQSLTSMWMPVYSDADDYDSPVEVDASSFTTATEKPGREQCDIGHKTTTNFRRCLLESRSVIRPSLALLNSGHEGRPNKHAKRAATEDIIVLCSRKKINCGIDIGLRPFLGLMTKRPHSTAQTATEVIHEKSFPFSLRMSSVTSIHDSTGRAW